MKDDFNIPLSKEALELIIKAVQSYEELNGIYSKDDCSLISHLESILYDDKNIIDSYVKSRFEIPENVLKEIKEPKHPFPQSLLSIISNMSVTKCKFCGGYFNDKDYYFHTDLGCKDKLRANSIKHTETYKNKGYCTHCQRNDACIEFNKETHIKIRCLDCGVVF